jgi:transforming growth factor-beta-induced protein
LSSYNPKEMSMHTTAPRRLVAVGIAALVAGALATTAVAAPAPDSARQTETKNIVETAVSAGQFTTLASLLTAANLVDALTGPGPFTVFAPTDAAFANVPKATLDALAKDPAKLRAILLYHVVAGSVPASEAVKLTSAKTLNGASLPISVAGGTVSVGTAKVVATDVFASNGVIHVIDSVLIPPALAAPKLKNIVATANGAGEFKTLTALLKSAGLAGTLQGKGPFTVFAPTDAAFAKVPKSTLAALAKDRALLRSVLLYHVAPGKLTAKQVTTRKAVRTLNGKPVAIRTAGKSVRIGGAKVVKADVASSNGVIHVIDRVLIPPAR